MIETLSKQLVIVQPSGQCPGVRRAIEGLQGIINDSQGEKPIFCVNYLVHNERIAHDFEDQGVFFIKPHELSLVSRDNIVASSAHGVPPSFYQEIRARHLLYADLTCPLVAGIQRQASWAVRNGRLVVYIGKRGHEEALSVTGIDPEHIFLVENEEEAKKLTLPWGGQRLVRLTQTTLSFVETLMIDGILRERFPEMNFRKNICPSTTIRQQAVGLLAQRVDHVLVLGSLSSNNSQMLVRAAHYSGTGASLANDVSEIDPRIFERRAVGLTAGASTPDKLMNEVKLMFRVRGFDVRLLDFPELTRREQGNFRLATLKQY